MNSTSNFGGEKLLANLHKMTRPLSDAEATAIASYLDFHEPSKVYRSGTEDLYRSKDLGLGVKKDRELQFLTAPSATRGSDDEDDGQGHHAPAEHFDLEIQKTAFEFVKSDARIEIRLQYPRPWIRLQGIRRTFYHFQLYGAFWMIKEERGHRRGMIEADLMGLGKTTTSYLYVLLNFFLAENAEDIRSHPERHCRPTDQEYGQSQNARCPTRDRWPIVCACEENSITSRLSLKPRDGATLILVPASLIGRWQAEWRAIGINEESIKLRLYTHHSGFREDFVPKHQLVHLALQRVDGRGVTAKAAPPSSNIAHRFMILTTVESYYAHIQSYCGARRQWKLTEGYAWDDAYTDGLAWARVVRDEAHLTPNWSTTLYRILESMAHNGWVPPNFVALTATPMLRNGVIDMLACVQIINLFSPNIGQHPPCAEFAQQHSLDKLAESYRSMRKKQLKGHKVNDKVIHIVTRAVGRLQAAYCLRRRNDSVQNNKPLANIPPLECYDVSCPIVGEGHVQRMRQVEGMLKARLTYAWEQRLTQWKTRGDDEDEPVCDIKLLLDNAVMSRILASVPGLTRYKTRKALTWAHIKAKKWHLKPEHSHIYADIESLEQSSGKLRMLRKLIQRLDVDVDAKPEKLVVVSEFPIICLVILCFCLRMEIPCEWMHAELDVTLREALASVFQGSREPESRVGRGMPFRVLTGSTRIMGQGLTLNKANRLVLVEPGRHAAVEAQIADRVHRIGSQTDRCWFYRLVNPDSALEKLLIQDQDGQLQRQLLSEWFRVTPQTQDRRDANLTGFLGYKEDQKEQDEQIDEHGKEDEEEEEEQDDGELARLDM